MTDRTLTSPVVANMVGISYRQLDYMIRSGAIAVQQTGFRANRQWTPDEIHRLQIAVKLNDVLNMGSTNIKASQLPRITAAAFSGPPPSGNWVVLRGDVVSYGATLPSLFPRAMDPYGAIVCRMPELWP